MSASPGYGEPQQARLCDVAGKGAEIRFVTRFGVVMWKSLDGWLDEAAYASAAEVTVRLPLPTPQAPEAPKTWKEFKAAVTAPTSGAGTDDATACPICGDPWVNCPLSHTLREVKAHYKAAAPRSKRASRLRLGDVLATTGKPVTCLQARPNGTLSVFDEDDVQLDFIAPDERVALAPRGDR